MSNMCCYKEIVSVRHFLVAKFAVAVAYHLKAVSYTAPSSHSHLQARLTWGKPASQHDPKARHSRQVAGKEENSL